MATDATVLDRNPDHDDPLLRDFVAYLADDAARLAREHAHRPLRYTSYQQIVLELGGRAAAARPGLLPGMRPGLPQLCYYNAARAAAADPDLVYVEGYAMAAFMPVRHAWCVHTPTGAIVDPTWVLLGHLEGPACYLGAAVHNDFLAELETPEHPTSLLDGDWRREFVALHRGFVRDEAGRITGYGPEPA